MSKPEGYDEAKRICQKAYDDGKSGRPFEPDDRLASNVLRQFYDRGAEIHAVQRRRNER